MAKNKFTFDDLNAELAGLNPLGSVMDQSNFSEVTEWIHTGNYHLNACLSGSVWGGWPNNRSCSIAGPSGTGKTFLTLNSVREAINMGYYVIYYDSEAAVDKDQMKKFGIDISKVNYQPVNTVQAFRTSITTITQKMQEVKRKGGEVQKIMIILDSAGNLATAKEIDDATSGSEKADMTRSKILKSIFRIIMTPLADLKIPFLFTNHTYQCIWGEAEVQMSDNTNKKIMDIQSGEFVKTLDGDKEVVSTTKFNKSYVIEFELENGTIFRCTPEHRFLVKDEWTKETSWKTAELLSENDIILQTN
jgi:hypothetical protein